MSCRGPRSQNIYDTYPALPASRPRPLTPSPSNETLFTTSTSASTISTTGPFFQKLPPEIRRNILVEAFGGRILHLDLAFHCPHCSHHSALTEAPADAGARHCGYAPATEHCCVLPTTHLPGGWWVWHASVCHHDPESVVRGGGRRGEPGGIREPWDDRCFSTGPVSCGAWAGDMPGKCFLGVMGWLLTCRQAYTEAIEVLYGTNTFHLRTPELVKRLPTLLLPQRLAAIRSVELTWPFFPLPGEKPAPVAAFASLMDAVPLAFPRLRKLYLSPRFPWFFTEKADAQSVARWEKYKFPQVGKAVARLEGLECVFTIQREVAKEIFYSAGRKRLWRNAGREGKEGRWWEFVDSQRLWEYGLWHSVGGGEESSGVECTEDGPVSGKGFWTVAGPYKRSR